MSLSNPTNPPILNEHVATRVSSGLVFAVDENQTKVNQIHGINPVDSTGAGIPKPVTNVSASIANASVGSTSTISINFQRNPSDKNFARVIILAKGYQGNNTPVQVGSGADSPATVILNNTGESVSLIVQSVGNGGSSPFNTSPTCAIKLPKNTNGGVGAQTVTNLTLSQIPSSVGSGSLAFGSIVAAPATVNLTTEGLKDWLIVSPQNSGVDIYNRQAWRWKALGGDLLLRWRWIASGVGSSFITSSTGGATAFSASNGDDAADPGDNFAGVGAYPLAAVTPYRGIAYVAPLNTFGFSLSCEANSVLRTLNLYIGSSTGGVSCTTTITARLEDGSASDISTTIVAVTGLLVYNQVPITFKSSSGSRLIVTIMITASNGATPQIVFQAATLA